MLSGYSGCMSPVTCKVFRLVFSLNFLLLKSNQQIPQGEGGLGELSQTNLENLGSALLIFLDFSALLPISLPAPCWELTVFLSSLLAPCWECFLAQNSASISILWTRSWCVYVMILLIHQQAAEIASWRGVSVQVRMTVLALESLDKHFLANQMGCTDFCFFPPQNFLSSLVIFSLSNLGMVFLAT